MFRSIVQSIFTISTRDAFLRFSFFSFPRYVSLLCILLEIFIARNQFNHFPSYNRAIYRKTFDLEAHSGIYTTDRQNKVIERENRA